MLRWTVGIRFKDGSSETSIHDTWNGASSYLKKWLKDPMFKSGNFNSTEGQHYIIGSDAFDIVAAQIEGSREHFSSEYVDGRWWIFTKPDANPLFTEQRYHHPSFQFMILASSFHGGP